MFIPYSLILRLHEHNCAKVFLINSSLDLTQIIGCRFKKNMVCIYGHSNTCNKTYLPGSIQRTHKNECRYTQKHKLTRTHLFKCCLCFNYAKKQIWITAGTAAKLGDCWYLPQGNSLLMTEEGLGKCWAVLDYSLELGSTFQTQ